MGEISIIKLLVVAALVILLLRTERLHTPDGDLETVVRGFKKAMNDNDVTAKRDAGIDLRAGELSHKE